MSAILKNILISGASSGIGASLAEAYSTSGVNLYLTARNNQRLKEVADKCQAKGAKVIIKSLDVREMQTLRDWVVSIDEKNPLDLVIANAGITGGNSIDGQLENDVVVNNLIDVNFKGMVHTIHPLLERMKSRKSGQLAFVTSVMAIRGFPHAPIYAATKAAVTIYAEGVRAVLRKDKVKISVILPGYVATPMSDQITGDKPFIVSAEKAAKIIKKGLRRAKPVIAFPKVLYYGTWILKILPPAISDRLMMSAKIDAPHENTK